MFSVEFFCGLEVDQFYCYVWHDPFTKLPVYVGKGNNKRYEDRFRSCQIELQAFLDRNILNLIYVDVFPCFSEKEAFQFEEELIYLFRSQGCYLYNLADGGEGGQHSQETCDKISFIQRSRTPERKKELNDKRLATMDARPQELKDLEIQRRHQSLKEMHAKKPPEVRSIIGKKCNDAKRKRPKEIIEDEIKRTSESNKRTHALIPFDVKQDQCTRYERLGNS